MRLNYTYGNQQLKNNFETNGAPYSDATLKCIKAHIFLLYGMIGLASFKYCDFLWELALQLTARLIKEWEGGGGGGWEVGCSLSIP